MLRSLNVLLAEGLDIVVTDLPAGEDPDTLVQRQGVDGWAALRANAFDAVEFVHRHVLRGARTTDAREKALRIVVELASGIADPVRVAVLIQRAAQVFDMPERVVARAVTFKKTGQRIETPLRVAVREQARTELQLEGLLLRALLHAPEELEAARQRLHPEDFRDPGARALAEWLWSGHEGLPEEEPVASMARELASSGTEGMNWHAEAEGATLRMMERQFRQRARELTRELARAPGSEAATRLMQESMDIARSRSEMSTQVGNLVDRESEE
jgi:DNA primase